MKCWVCNNRLSRGEAVVPVSLFGQTGSTGMFMHAEHLRAAAFFAKSQGWGRGWSGDTAEG